MPGDAFDVMTRFWTIQNDRDYTALVQLFAKDAVLEDPIWGRYEGREKIMAFMATMNVEMAKGGIHFQVDEICGDDTTAWATWRAVMPEGERTGIGIYKVKDGQITYYRDAMDPPPAAENQAP